jgi:NADH-quinone oxidoreductase subunit N
MSAAFLLFGFSLLYGLSNSTSLPRIAAAIHGPALNPLLVIAIVTTAIGLGFKVAAVPFHFWAPDVYQGAPAPSAAFIASGSKVAGFFLFFQVMALGFAGVEGTAVFPYFVRGWVPVLALMATASMLLGNLVAIRQTSLRRLLAYSAIAHAGYMLLAIVAHSEQSLAALLYYVVTYALATLGAFGMISVVEEQKGGDQLSNFDGLGRQAPVLSFCLAIFILSLAGIPPLAGFFGKFYLFVTVLNAAPGSMGLLWLVVFAIAMSAVSLYYYLRVLKRVYVAPPAAGAAAVRTPVLTQVLLLVLAASVVLLGCAPQLLLRWIMAAIRVSGL